MLSRAIFMVGVAALTAATVGAQQWQPDRFPISYWSGPPSDSNTLEAWQTVADCNFTYAGTAGGYSVEENLQRLDLCQQVGLKAMVVDPRVSWTMTAAPDWEQLVADIVADYGDHPALFGYYVKDEPNYRNFEPLGQIVAEFVERDPEHLAYINLFPTYASVQQLGTPTYADHVEKYLQIVDPQVLSYDHYCLLRDGGIRPDYFENLQIIRDAALRHDVPPWQIILSTAHLSYRDPTEGEMRWQVYTSLAYGMKGLMYFTYWSRASAEDDMFAIVDSEGNPQRLYPIVRDLNAEVLALGDTLLDLTSTGVYHTGEVPRGGMRPGTDCIVQLPEDLPLLLGLFEDPEGMPYAMVVNRDYAEPVELSARLLPHVTGVRAISAETDEAEAVELTDHEIALQLPPGGGRLLRLQTQFEYPQPPEFVESIDFQFNTDGDAAHWSTNHALADAVVSDGTLTTRVTGRDPYMSRLYLRVEPDRYSAVRVRMRITGGVDEGQLFWATAAEPKFSDGKFLNFAIQPDGEWHEYTIPVGEHEKWRGQQIVGLRLDPSVGAEGEEVEIDWIVAD